jgi:hypothetical protein
MVDGLCRIFFTDPNSFHSVESTCSCAQTSTASAFDQIEDDLRQYYRTIIDESSLSPALLNSIRNCYHSLTQSSLDHQLVQSARDIHQSVQTVTTDESTELLIDDDTFPAATTEFTESFASKADIRLGDTLTWYNNVNTPDIQQFYLMINNGVMIGTNITPQDVLTFKDKLDPFNIRSLSKLKKK